MKKTGILGLIAGGAALAGLGLFKLLKKSNTVEDADIVTDYDDVVVYDNDDAEESND